MHCTQKCMYGTTQNVRSFSTHGWINDITTLQYSPPPDSKVIFVSSPGAGVGSMTSDPPPPPPHKK